MTTIAEQLFTASPCIAAFRSEPFTIAEIDAHPDAGRIWATIEAMKAKAEVMAEETDREVDEEIDAAREEGEKEGYEDAASDIETRVDALLKKYDGDLSDNLYRDIEALTEGL